jgi:hypothetical protein
MRVLVFTLTVNMPVSRSLVLAQYLALTNVLFLGMTCSHVDPPPAKERQVLQDLSYGDDQGYAYCRDRHGA